MLFRRWTLAPAGGSTSLAKSSFYLFSLHRGCARYYGLPGEIRGRDAQATAATRQVARVVRCSGGAARGRSACNIDGGSARKISWTRTRRSEAVYGQFSSFRARTRGRSLVRLPATRKRDHMCGGTFSAVARFPARSVRGAFLGFLPARLGRVISEAAAT